MDLTGKVISSSCSVIKSVMSDVGPDIPGQPYSISVLKEGYCLPQPNGCTRADGTISLLLGPKTILVDTGGPWDRDFLLAQLEKRGLKPDDISVVVGTHGHSDHVLIVPTPGHTGRDVSVLVKDTSVGVVLVAGDLFECCADEDSWRALSENPQVQEVNRRAALHTADVIIPGHGPLFKVQRVSTN
ncbi:metallo-beta-lactamase domain-containing protein 1 isoform X2 [Clupea harengus]|uniref:Metallo-beta-lactamase domain-containing protein 1 n=1 Tax=Clupea harengus TaxID=7950 RepID=A0A6P8H014_CLUHA|nr:metallo-beta-lactamase domain-containing protein 1 isoform X2 [Clupea harengus]